MRELDSNSVPAYVESPIYVSPLDFVGKEADYLRIIRQANKAQQRTIKGFLENRLQDRGNGYAILTTGSDGRFEKGPYHTSKLELVLLVDESDSHCDIKQVVGDLQRMYEGEIFDDLDIRNVNTDCMSRYLNSPERTFPSIIGDSVLLTGSLNLAQKARMKMYSEFVSEKGRSILGRVGRKSKEARSIIKQEGKQRYRGKDVHHFKFEDGKVKSMYDPNGGLLSFKSGPLRFVQYTLMHEAIKQHRATPTAQQEENAHFMGNLPTAIDERLQHLQDEGRLNLNPSEVNDLINSYTYFVWAYNLVQEGYQDRNQKVVVFDKEEVAPRLDAIQKILSQKSEKVLIK